MIAIILSLVLTVQAVTPSKGPPVTIEVAKDVMVEPYKRDREAAHIRSLLQFFNDEKPVVIQRGQQFEMFNDRGSTEGGCWIRFETREYDIASCWWREGFTDHHTDVFVVKK